MTDSGNMNGSDLLRYAVGAVTTICREHPDWSVEQVARVFLPQAHDAYGGDSYYLPKRDPGQQEAAREAVLRDAASAVPARELQQRHGISRSSMYRLMKTRKP
jgi:Mor family transcriptional regulator